MSMKGRFAVEIQGKPEFRFHVPKEDVEVLVKFAKRHYDYECNRAAMGRGDGVPENGILKQWQNAYAWSDDSDRLRDRAGKEPQEPPQFRVTWDELDLLLKITEVMHNPGETEEDNAIAWKYHFAWKRVLDRANQLYKQWKEVCDAGPQ